MKHTSFLQSAHWQSFQKEVGVEAVRVQDALALIHTIGPFKYAYLPRVDADEAVFDALKQQGCVFARVEGKANTAKTQVKTHNRQPKTTLILDLTSSEDDLLANMHSKSRYNVRLAERKGVEIKKEKNADLFWELNTETTSRDKFKSNTASYYKQFIAMDMCTQYTAYFEGTPIASILTLSYDGVTTYVHGASSNVYRNTMAPYLLQWTAIKSAKIAGDTQYDFWGIAPVHPQGTQTQETCYNGYCWEITHKWTGITRFKVGFGGAVVTYTNATDVVLRPLLYALYQFIHRLRYGRK